MERREAMIGERLTALKPDTTIAQIAARQLATPTATVVETN